MKKFLIKLILLSPVPLLMAGVSYFIDPANIYGHVSYTKDIAAIFLRGANVAETGPWEERLVQKYFIDGLRDRKDVVVFGSSRSGAINSGLFPGLSFHNNFIGGAVLKDFLAMYDMYREKKILPKYLILEMTPWLLNGGYADFLAEHDYTSDLAARIISKNYNHTRELLGLPPVRINQIAAYKYLISPNYFQKSIRELVTAIKNGSGSSRYYETAAESGELIIRMADGSVRSKDSFYNAPDEVARTNAMDIEANSWGLINFSQIDPGLKAEFELFIGLAKKDGVTVLFYIPPYHPVAYKLLIADERFKILAEQEKYFREFARRHKITVLGSYDAAALPIKESDFGDNFHVRTSCVIKIFSKVRLPKLK